MPDTNTSAVDSSAYGRVWRQDLTVPLFLIVVLFPLINFKSPTFFTKLNALGTYCYFVCNGGRIFIFQRLHCLGNGCQPVCFLNNFFNPRFVLLIIGVQSAEFARGNRKNDFRAQPGLLVVLQLCCVDTVICACVLPSCLCNLSAWTSLYQLLAA